VSFPSFYRPEFLWGLLFLIVVLLIHLLRRPPRRSFDFSTLRFFTAQTVKTARMRQIRKLLLLLSRLAAVAALVLLFSQPFDRHEPLNILHNPHLTVFTWIDRTPSMDYSEKNMPLYFKARTLIDSLRSSLPSTIRFFQYDETQSGFAPVDLAGTPTARTRHGPPRLDKVIRAWNDTRESCSLPLLVLFSDYQKSTSVHLDTLLPRALLPKQKSAHIMCVTLAPRSPWNFSVRNAAFSESGKVSATLAARGRNLDSVFFTITMSSIGTGRKAVSLKAGDTLSAEAAVAGSALETAGGNAALDAPDPLAFDNIAYFVSRNRTSLRVLIVGDRERNFPLAAALSASGEKRWSPVTLKENNAVTFDELDSADVVIINAITRPSRPLEALFSGQSLTGKTVLLALDEDEQGFSACAALIARVNRSLNPLQPVTLQEPAFIVLPDTLLETWQGFPSLRTRESSIYRYGTGLPGTVLLRLDNGSPLVTHIDGKRGNSIFIVATPLGITEANNLCETGFYVPFIDRITCCALNGHPVPADVWIAGFERKNPFYSSGKSATVLNEEGKILERWLCQPSVLFKQPGLYKIVPDGGEPYMVSANADPDESDCNYQLPVLPDAIKDNVFILNEIELRKACAGHGGLRSYLPWLFLILLLLSEVLLWDSPAGRPEKNQTP
jgi:hypothetical protein